MTTQIDYEAIVRSCGWCVLYNRCGYYLHKFGFGHENYYDTPEEACKVFCVENNLVEGESDE